MRWLYGAVVILGFLAGHAPPATATPTSPTRQFFPEADAKRHYAVNLGPELAPRDVDAMHVAMRAWKDAMPDNAYLRFIEVPECKTPPSDYELVCVHTQTVADIRNATGLHNAIAYTGKRTGADGEPYWYLALPEEDVLDEEERLRAATHELGHAMHLGHCHIPGTVMYPNVDHGALTPTHRDIMAWERVRR